MCIRDSWYIDGGEQADHVPELTCVSYKVLEPARAELLRRMQAEIDRPGMGPETLRTLLAQMHPAELGLERESNNKPRDQVLERFEVSLLTEGSGTQVFSTSFAQWAAREALRRAQPLTLLVRFAPRQRQKPMNELLVAGTSRPEFDFVGSLIDADFEMCIRDSLESFDYLGEEGIFNIGDDDSERAAITRSEMASVNVGNVSHALHCTEHNPARVRANLSRLVQDVGNGRSGNTGCLRNITNSDTHGWW